VIQFGDIAIGREEREAVLAVLESGRLSRGARADDLDAELHRITGQPCRAVSSGTAALHLALLAAGVGEGDEVIVPATSFVATYNAVLYCGATPVVVDVDPLTWTIDQDRAIAKVTPATKAIVPVNLYGVPPTGFRDWQAEHYAATGRKVAIVEDAAEGLGAKRSGHPACGDLTCYSFYASKTITCGEGGAVGWSDPLHGRRVVHLSGQAQTQTRYLHDALGFNYRITDVHAAIALEQAKKLYRMLAGRRMVFQWYSENLPDNYRPQGIHKDDTHGVWAFAAFRRDGETESVRRAMALDGIETRPVFPPANWHKHLRRYCAYLDPHHALAAHLHGIVLPTHCMLTQRDVKYICESLARHSK
jgi:perosamine synthetase